MSSLAISETAPSFSARWGRLNRRTTSPILLALIVSILAISVVGCADEPPEEVDVEVEVEVDPFRVITYSVWRQQAEWPRRLAIIVEEMRRLEPDLVCLQEVLQYGDGGGQAEVIADSLGYEAWFFPGDTLETDNRVGAAVLSRESLSDTTSFRVDTSAVNSVAGHAGVTVGERNIDFYCVRLQPAASDTIRDSTSQQVHTLLAFVDSTADGPNTLLAGSLNLTPDSPQLDTLQQTFDDVFAGAGSEGLRPPTLNQYVGHPPLTMDYIFVRPESDLTLLGAARELDEADADGIWPSDRFAIIADFAVEEIRRRRR